MKGNLQYLPKCYMCGCMLNHFSQVPLCDPVDCNPPAFSVHEMLQGKYWGGLLCPPPGDLPDPRIKPESLMSNLLWQ